MADKKNSVDYPKVVYQGKDVTDFVRHLYDNCRYTNIFQILQPFIKDAIDSTEPEEEKVKELQTIH